MTQSSLNEGRIISKATLKLMHQWHKLDLPIQYGYRTMYFKLPWFIATMINARPLWGHSGSPGSFLYYSEELNLYMSGTITPIESNDKPWKLMIGVMRAISWSRENLCFKTGLQYGEVNNDKAYEISGFYSDSTIDRIGRIGRN